MAVNYDDVIKQNKRNLTRAQIQALAKAADKFSAENAGNRADALASLRNQYDTGYRGLQNMGLAGGLEAQATSGEVPRLKGGIQDAFDKYNATLSNVEHQRLTALGTKYANATKRARAEAALKQQQAALAAAERAEVAYDTSSQSARDEKLAMKRYERAVRQAQEQAQTAYDVSSQSARDEKLALKRAEKKMEQMQTAYDTSSQFARDEKMAINRAVQEQQREMRRLNAAAELLGVSMPTVQNIQALHEAEGRLNVAGANAANSTTGNTPTNVTVRDNGELTGRTKGPTIKTQEQLEARRDVKNAEAALADYNGRTPQDTSAQAKYDAAKKKYEEEEAAWNQKVVASEHYEDKSQFKVQSGSTSASNLKRGINTNMTDTASNKTNVGSTNKYAPQGTTYVRDAQDNRTPLNRADEPESLVRARNEFELADMQLNAPDAYNALNIISNRDQYSTAAFEKAVGTLADYNMKQMGFKTPSTTDKEYEREKNVAPGIQKILDQIDSERLARDNAIQTKTLGDRDYYQEFVDDLLKELKDTYGVNEKEARELAGSFKKDRDARSEYNYYKPGMVAQLQHQGEKPVEPVNKEETDENYRIINGLPSIRLAGLGGAANTATFTVQKYMSQEQKDQYNAIYEKDGIEAANQYFKDITPYLNIERAMQDEAYYQEFAKEHPVLADLRSVGANVLWNMPAMTEMLLTGAENMFSDEQKYFDLYSDASFRSARADTIRTTRSEQILNNTNRSEWVNGVYNFAYQTGMSMADSAVAMAFAYMGAPTMVDALFFSSAGISAYKDAKERGATQDQAMLFGSLSGAAEAVFEHLSIEHFLKMDYVGKGALVKNLKSQMLAEGSEEVSTALADLAADELVMMDKSQLRLDAKKYMRDDPNISEEDAYKKAYKDQLWDIVMSGVGGAVSGGLFGLGGAVLNEATYNREGAKIKAPQMERMTTLAELLGGGSKEVLDRYNEKQTNRNAGELQAVLEKSMKEMFSGGENALMDYEANEGVVDKAAAGAVILSGDRMSDKMARSVLTVMGNETLESMGYDASSPESFAKSYNARLDQYNIKSQTDMLRERAAKFTEARKGSAYQQIGRKASSAGVSFAGSALHDVKSRKASASYNAARINAAEQVWANPEQGLSLTADGRKVASMPGNMTAISFAEQERNNFQTRASAKTGNVTYAVAGMQTREGLSNEQTLSEIKKGLTKEARQKAEFYEKLSSALGIPMVIHDVMTGTNGFIDEDGNMHVVLSGKQSVLRVAAHELTHWGKNKNASAYSALREHLINEVGDERFDRMLKQKAKEYGIDLSTEKGKALADDEVCAELCERMLSNEDALEKFAMKNTEAAKSLKDHLVKILNAIKQAFKQASNRDFGDSWSDLIQSQDTIESWISMLQGAVDKAERQAQTSEGQIAQTAGITVSEQEAMLDDIHEVTETAKEAAAEVKAEKKEAAAEVKAEAKAEAKAETKAERDPLKARRYVSVTSTSNRSQGRSFEGGKAPKGMTNLSYKMDNAESFGRKLVTGSMSDYANFGYSSYFGNLDGDAYGYSKNTWRSDNGRAILDSQAAVSSAADLKQGDAFLDDVVRMNFLSSDELGNAGSMEESDVANRAPVKLPSLTPAEEQFAKNVAKTLSSDGQVVVQLPVSDNFDGEARATLQAIFEAMPANKRTGISFATGLTAADIAKAGDVNLVITDESQNVSKDGRQVVKMPSMQDELFMDEETERRQDAKKAAQETAKKKTYVRGYTAAEVDKVLAAGVLGDKSNYEGNDYEEARGMIAQLIPDVVAALKGEADVFEVNDKIKTAVGAMLDNYIEDNGDMTALRKAIPPQIGVDTTAKSDLKHQDLSLFQMSAKLSKALGRKTTIVGPTNAQYNITEKLEDLWPKIRDQFGLGEEEDFSVDLPKFLSYVEREANTRKQGEGVFGPHMQDEIDAIAADIVDAVSEMYSAKTGVTYSLDTEQKRDNGVRFSVETDLLTNEDFEHNINAIKSMDPVVSVDSRFALPGTGDVAERVYKTIGGGSVRNKYVGLISITKSGIKNDFEHGYGAEKINAVPAIRDVLKNGLPVHKSENWKNRGYDTVLLAAPIKIGDQPYLMGISLKTTKDYTNFELHEVVVQKITTNEPFTNGAVRESVEVSRSSYSGYIKNILKKMQSVNTPGIFSLDTDAARKAFTMIDTEGIEDGLEALKGVKNVGAFSRKDMPRFLDAISNSSKDKEANKNLRNTLNAIFEKPHSEATGRYARGVGRMQQRVLDIGARAGVCDAKGNHFDSKKSAAIQNIGEGFSNTYTDLKVKVKDADRVTVRAYEQGTDKLVVSEKDYTLKQLRQAYGTNAADYVWQRVFDETQKAQNAGKEAGWVEETVNTRPYTLADLQSAFPNEWQQLKQAADEFRQMYDEYIRDQNSMLSTIYPYASEYESVDKMENAIEKKQERLARHKVAVEQEIADLTKRLEETEKSLANKQATGAAAVRLSELRSELASVEKAIVSEQKTKQEADRLSGLYDDLHKTENEMLSKKRTDTKEYAKLTDKANRLYERITQIEEAANDRLSKKADTLRKRIEKQEAETEKRLRRNKENLEMRISEAQADIQEYEANVKEELAVMNAQKAQMQNAVQSGESLTRMHRLQYRSDYFHHFTEMANGIQNLKAIFTGNTDISPAIVGRSENTKAKTKWAGYFQQRMGGDYTADAINGMFRYGQLAEYKLAFDPLVAYLRDVNKQIRELDDNTNRDGLIRYIDQWTDAIAGKSHKLDRLVSDAGMAPRKAMQVLNWINSRVIQNTLLFNMRSSLMQISNITNAKGIVTNNLDWMNGLRCWAAAVKGNNEMASIMAQSNFLASRYMDNMALTDSALKKAKNFGGWMLGALDEISAKATWWAAYTQYQRNPNAAVIKNAYRTYDNAIDYADDVTRRTHAGRGVGELAPAMTSRVVNFVAPFQVEVNNTFELFKDNIKQKNYLGLLSTGLSVFLFNTVFEAIVGSSPLQFDFIRAVMDIVLGFKNDDPDDDDDDYGILQAWQRLGGEVIGSLPFAGQLVSIIGEDTAKKIFGEGNDATRYGNTQIGISAVTNAGKGVYDIGKSLLEGKSVNQINWISDLDDLINLTLPMGGKQLTRSIQGLYTVAKGYGGKVDKEGNEQVQFTTDQDILHYIHAGLFGKWALTEASEYFGEERQLPKLFGAYEGSKSSIGKPIDAKQYKAALNTGIDGKDFFTLKDDLKGYTTQTGKRAEMMQQKFTPEQKAKLDALLFRGKDAEMKADGAVVYQKNSDGEWKVKADYSNQDMFDLSQAGDKTYTGTLDAMDKTGLPQDQAALAADMWSQAKDADDSKATFRNLLRDNKNLTVEQKEALDLQYTGNKYPADYSDPDLYELSTTNRDLYDKAKEAKSKGVPVKTYTGLYEKKKAHEGDGQATYMRNEIMNSNLTVKQKELLDDMLVSDKGRNPDYSTKAWFEISMISESQYEKAKEGTKVGVKPETYLAAYKKRKELNAKDKDGKYVYTRKEARAMFKEYLDKLTITAPAYEYLWAILK